MKALITGASSGIGKDIARILAARGIDLILVARSQEKLEAFRQELPVSAQIISLDLANEKNCYALYEKCRSQSVDILINNAGFGVFGRFSDSSLTKDLSLIDVNIKAVHILTKLFLKDFLKRDFGYILNVASSAGFSPGPLMAPYYASKAYVLRLSESIYGELKKQKKNVSISVLCPGPVRTEFNRRAGVSFTLHSLSSEEVAKQAVDGMFNKKLHIIPGKFIKGLLFLQRFTPSKLNIRISYHFQHAKENKK